MRAVAFLLAATLAFAVQPASAGSSMAPELDRARMLLADARYAAAESLSRALLGGNQGHGRHAALDSAAVLEVLVESLWKNDRGGGPEPLALAERGVAIRERLLGTNSPELATSLCQLSAVLAYTGRPQDAEPHARRALRVAEGCGARGELAAAQAWHSLALTRYLQGDFADARECYRRGLEIRQRLLPADHPLVGTSWRAVAAASDGLEDLATSADAWRRALENADRALRRDHPDRGRCLQGFSMVLFGEQRYGEAQRAAEEALDINRLQLGREHPQVAYSCLALAWNLGATGDYGRARNLYEEAHRIFLAAYGPDDFRTLSALDRVAWVMVWDGQCAEALPISEQVVATMRRALGEDHRELRSALTTLELAHECLGHVDQALEAVMEESRRVAAASQLDITMMTSAQRREGRLRLRKGDADSALALLRRARALAPSRYGPDSPQVLLTEEWLGTALMVAGQADSARDLLRRVAATVERVSGPSSSAAGTVLARLAAAEAACGDSLAAVATALRAESAAREAFRSTARGFSETEALAAAAVRARGLDLALTIARRMTLPESLVVAVWDAVVRSRALVEDEIAGRRQTLAWGDDSLRAELFASRAELARLLARGPAGADSIWRRQTAEIEQRRDRAERTLAIGSAASRSEHRRATTGIQPVLASLPEGTSLVSFVRHQTGAPFGGAPLWTALVRRRDGRLAVRSLGDEGHADGALADWLVELSRPAAGPDARSAEKRCRRAGETVRKIFWDPLARDLDGSIRVDVVPDGTLALTNLAALPVGTDRWLIDSGPTLAMVGAERDLVSDGEARGTGLLVAGGIDYDARSERGPSAARSGSESDRSLAPCAGVQARRFEPLIESGKEAAEVFERWRASGGDGEVRTGAAANEEAIRRLAPGRRVLHLATHGFYVDPACALPLADGSRGVGGLAKGTPDLPSLAVTNPMRLSGLALAGANARLADSTGGDDGILTAGELAAIDLSGLELVTLSACESGRGQAVAGEGVLGLRRAIRVAGARATVLSLWAVGDRSAREWMSDFYRGLWAEGLDLHAAARAASRAALARLRARGRPTHPVEWAAMIAEGP